MRKTKPTIAVVDDDASVCRAISRLLRSLGMNADTFTSGREFIERIEMMPSFLPDCVVLDVQMPEMNGLEVQELLVRSENALPVIFITAHDEIGVRERLQAGAVAFLRKPFNDELLIKILDEAIKRGAGDKQGGRAHSFLRRKEFKGMRPKSIRVSPERHFHPAWPAILFTTAFIVLSGCVVSEPVPAYAPSPSTFERAWSAAIGAAQDEGVRITSEDRVKGVISGSRGEQDVTINVQTQADGNVRVEFSAKGPKGSDPGLAGRISRAYDRRMGR